MNASDVVGDDAVGAARGGDRSERDRGKKKGRNDRTTVIVLFFEPAIERKLLANFYNEANFSRARAFNNRDRVTIIK